MATAKAIIQDSIASLINSDSPDTVRAMIAGEINMAYKLGLIDYTERDRVMTVLHNACISRRETLHRERLARLRGAL